MIECALQCKPDGSLHPFSQEDLEKIKGFSPNQVLKAKLWGAKKPRSYIQLKLYWACCRTVVENLDGMSPEDVDFEVKVQLKHIRAFRVVDKVTFIEVDSIAFKNLPHLEACNFFDRAFPVMAKMISVSVEELLQNTQMGM